MKSLELSERYKSRLSTRIGFITMLLITSILIVIETLYHKRLFAASIKISLYLQELDIYIMSHIVSHFIFFLIFIYVPIAFLVKRTSARVFLHFIEFFFCLYLQSALKLFFRDSRPSFESADLNSGLGFCEPDYGKPSGHAMMSMNILLIIANDLSHKHNLVSRIISYTVCICFSFVICFTRLYFGVHSFVQTILGMAIGLTVFLFFDGFEHQLAKLLAHPLLYRDADNRRGFSKSILLIAAAANSTIFLLWAYAHHVETYTENYFGFVQNCVTMLNFNINFSLKLLLDGLIFNAPLGLLLGLYYSGENVRLGTNFYYDKHVGKCICRVLIFFVKFGFMAFAYVPTNLPLPLMLTRALFVPLFVGFLTGKYLFKVLEISRLDYQKSDVKIPDSVFQ